MGLIFSILILILIFTLIESLNANNPRRKDDHEICRIIEDWYKDGVISLKEKRSLRDAHTKEQLLDGLFNSGMNDLIDLLPLSWTDDIDRYYKLLEVREKRKQRNK